MPGLDVARRLKAGPATTRVPIVALTGRDEAADRDALMAAGCAAYLVKPVDTHRLIESLPGYIASS
jgi:CheY-like chemotaxis protein